MVYLFFSEEKKRFTKEKTIVSGFYDLKIKSEKNDLQSFDLYVKNNGGFCAFLFARCHWSFLIKKIRFVLSREFTQSKTLYHVTSHVQIQPVRTTTTKSAQSCLASQISTNAKSFLSLMNESLFFSRRNEMKNRWHSIVTHFAFIFFTNPSYLHLLYCFPPPLLIHIILSPMNAADHAEKTAPDGRGSSSVPHADT